MRPAAKYIVGFDKIVVGRQLGTLGGEPGVGSTTEGALTS